MPQHKVYVSSFDITIELTIIGTSLFCDTVKSDNFWQEFVPNFSRTPFGDVVSTWHISESDQNSFDIEKQLIQTNASHVREIVVIIESVFELHRQKRNMYTFHGSAIADGNTAVGFIGNVSGIGKTTMGSYAARSDWSWIADEKFTVSKNHIVGSTKGTLNDQKSRQASRGFQPSMDSSTEYELKLICSPVVTTEKNASRHVWSRSKKLWIYNDEISRDIRQVNGTLNGFTESLQSVDTRDITLQRKAAVEQLADSTTGVFIRGSEATILKDIKTLLATK